MLKTAADYTVCSFVYYIINPWRGSTTPSRYLGWFMFTITYTFSGLKRPGATVPLTQEAQVMTIQRPLALPPPPSQGLHPAVLLYLKQAGDP